MSFKTFEYSYFTQRFPNIASRFSGMGYSLPHDRVPISPAFHYAIGGIKTDLNGKVSNVQGLYAVGEAASTGVHGANRLASNSLLEGLVFASRAAQTIEQQTLVPCQHNFKVADETLILRDDKQKKDRLRKIMWENVSIVRNKKGLESALSEIETMLDEKVGRLLYLRLLTAKEIVRSALQRRESVGVHYRKD